ncbi:MAG: sigma-70 family RNA polymerase sigma factor [Candidatus Omnitrophica bacterium]|nr:sigma-70 family RNA polymerase sigma factor [Candidatus Omnitrophota bacterium]
MREERDDNILIDKFLAGEREGFEMLVRKYQNRVVNIIYSLGSQIHNAEDIAQEVFIKVYKNLRFFRRGAKFSTWLYRITVNTAYTFLKREQKYVALEYLGTKESTGKENVALDNLEYKERQALVKKALSMLPFKYRTVLVLRDIEGLSYRDIAKTLGCFVGTVESRLFRAHSLFKRIVFSLVKKEDIL